MNAQNTAIVPGSIAAVSAATGKSLAESFLSVDLLCLIDMSGSMAAEDAPGGIPRYIAACKELTSLQAQYPGKIGVIAFSGNAEFVPGGQPALMGGDTDMIAALRAAFPVDNLGIKIVLISDGEPDEPEATLQEAGRFKTHIDTVYIGPEMGAGRDFLQRLAAATGGIAAQSAQPGMLREPVALLMAAA